MPETKGGGGMVQPPPSIGLISEASLLRPLLWELRRLGLSIPALWCPDAAAAIEAAAAAEIPFVATQPDDVLLRKEVGMVVVATTPSLQAPLADKALGIGKHVLCLPPGALGRSQASGMVSAAGYYPSILALVGFGLRHLPSFQAARAALRGGRIGRVFAADVRVSSPPLLDPQHFDWRWDSGMGGGALHLLGAEFVDALSFLLGTRAERVQGSCRAQTSGPPKDGFRSLQADNWAAFILHFPLKVAASVRLSALGAAGSRLSFEVCLEGSLGRLVVGEKAVVEERHGEAPRRSSEESDDSHIQLFWRDPGDIPSAFSRGLGLALSRVAAGETSSLATFQDAAYAQAVLATVRKASNGLTSLPVLL